MASDEQQLRRERQIIHHVESDVRACGRAFGIMAPTDGLAAVVHWCTSAPGRFHAHTCMCGERTAVAVVICNHPIDNGLNTCQKVVDGLRSTKVGDVEIISSDPCGHLVQRQKEERPWNANG